MRVASLFAALLATAAVAKPGRGSVGLNKRDTTQACTDLTIDSNNGDRKVAIVIDTSSSMGGSDPSNLRLAAGRALNEFLISNGEAGGGRKADQVVVVGFSSSSYTVFGPGDPGDLAADTAISHLNASGGTYIASGVYKAIDHISAMAGATKDRSAIVVFTDGSVSLLEITGRAGSDSDLGSFFLRTLTRTNWFLPLTTQPVLEFGSRLATSILARDNPTKSCSLYALPRACMPPSPSQRGRRTLSTTSSSMA
jgi:Mg-chelatase subunit ChlD